GTYVLVEADRGVDLGMIKEDVASADDADDVSPATENSGSTQPASGKDVYVKRIFRVADQCEVADLLNNKVVDEQNALNMCQSKVQQRKLSMCVVDAEFQFDRRKLTFYFTADRRVDFRELVRDLFKHFKTRIWMCQQQQ
ncbi:PSP1 C-terminal conserved region-domain-containing protein, partial [Coemansia mojavensis]